MGLVEDLEERRTRLTRTELQVANMVACPGQLPPRQCLGWGVTALHSGN